MPVSKKKKKKEETSQTSQQLCRAQVSLRAALAGDNRAPSMAGTCARHVVAILFALSVTLNNRAVGYKEVSCAITLEEGANCIGPALRLKGQSIGTENVMDGDRFTGSERERQRSSADLLERHILFRICWR